MWLGGGADGPTDVSVSDSVTRDNGNVGLYLRGSIARPIAVEVDHVRSARNANDGIVAVTDVRGTVTDSITSRNGNDGVIVFGPASEPVSLGLERVTTTGNTYGLHAHGDAAKITASDSTIEYNTTGLFTENSGQLVSRLNNTLTDNGTDGAFTSTIAAAFRVPRD